MLQGDTGERIELNVNNGAENTETGFDDVEEAAAVGNRARLVKSITIKYNA